MCMYVVRMALGRLGPTDSRILVMPRVCEEGGEGR